MKAVMYHYVRPDAPGLKFFRYLPLSSFRQQLTFFEQHYGFVSQDNFFEALDTGTMVEGIVLTFDDSLMDHYQYVFPILQEMGAWGLFFVPSAMYQTGKLLDVHRIHLILGLLGGDQALARLRELLTDDMLVNSEIETFRPQTYWNQVNDESTTYFKRVLNYYISYDNRGWVIDRIMAQCFEDERALAKSFYMQPEHIRELHQGGMVVGSHGVNHRIFSKLATHDQRQEIEESFDFLERLIGQPVTTFCYPYGGPQTFTSETEALLAENGCKAAFKVESRDIVREDLIKGALALPRYDTNDFPHGTNVMNQQG